MATVAVTLLFLFTWYYAWFLLRARSGLARLAHAAPDTNPSPFVSVVIAARNEERSIEQCLLSVVNQDYPADRFEVIVVDDHSVDGTVPLVEHLAEQYRSLRLVRLSSHENAGRRGKPAAISAGIDTARGEIIFTTDADCVVPHRWISTVHRYFRPDVVFAAGPVRIAPEDSILAQLDKLEVLGLITMAAGLIGSSRPIICNGANLAYRKSAFLAARGFGENAAWCDDETIMHRIHERKLGAIAFVPEEDATVGTMPASTFSSFWRQRLRWSAKGGHYEDTGVLLSLVLLYCYFLFFLTAVIVSITNVTFLPWVLGSLLVKLTVDLSTLTRGATLFRDRIAIVPFLVAELFHVPYIVITAALGQFASFTWKGRTVNA